MNSATRHPECVFAVVTEIKHMFVLHAQTAGKRGSSYSFPQEKGSMLLAAFILEPETVEQPWPPQPQSERLAATSCVTVS